MAELAFLAVNGAEPQCTFAGIALQELSSWDCQPLTLSSTELAVAQQFSLRLLARGLIPEDERNDGKILAQTSQGLVPLLVTSDKHLLDIDEDRLSLAFREADLQPVHPVHPRKLLRALR